MTHEDKELLLKELCARLPYGTIIRHEGWNYEWDDSFSTWERVVGIDDKFVYTKVIDTKTGEEYREDSWPISTFDDKPYLRPMTSMTEEEKQELSIQSSDLVFNAAINAQQGYNIQTCAYNVFFVDFLNKHHFDYSGLIEKGLALEAPEGMYKL